MSITPLARVPKDFPRELLDPVEVLEAREAQTGKFQLRTAPMQRYFLISKSFENELAMQRTQVIS
jgi:hypothetical protein